MRRHNICFCGNSACDVCGTPKLTLWMVANLIYYIVLPIVMIAALITEKEIFQIITIVLLVPLMLALVGMMVYFMSKDFINNLAGIVAWRYIRDEKYHGFSIQAQRKLFGKTWWTDEYISGSEEEAKRLVGIKN